LNLIVAGLKRDWLPIAIILLFVAGTHLIRLHYELPGISYNSFLTNAILVSSGLFVSGVFGLGRMLGVDRPVRPFAYLNTNPEVQAVMRNLVQSLLLIFPVCLFLPSFGLLKSLVGFLQPYEWDSVFIRWDLMIHGQDAWRAIQPLIGYPKVTFFFAMAYQMWILLLYIAFPLVCIWRGNRLLRQQMIISFLLCWIIIGVVMANWLASLGPCFLEPMIGNPRFHEQMAYLASVDKLYPLFVLDVQKELLESYLAGNHGLGRGISAMPSMHVSIAFLFAMFSWRVSFRLGIAAATYCMVILLGSVHLGYHYAVDGYVAIVATLIIWVTAGLIANKLPTRTRNILKVN
jgi:hypothetical protein